MNKTSTNECRSTKCVNPKRGKNLQSLTEGNDDEELTTEESNVLHTHLSNYQSIHWHDYLPCPCRKSTNFSFADFTPCEYHDSEILWNHRRKNESIAMNMSLMIMYNLSYSYHVKQIKSIQKPESAFNF